MYSKKRVIRPNNEVVRYYCDNGYGLSVACHEHSYGGKEGLYEIALLKDDKIHYDDEWTDVRGWLTRAEVWSWLRIVSEYCDNFKMGISAICKTHFLYKKKKIRLPRFRSFSSSVIHPTSLILLL